MEVADLMLREERHRGGDGERLGPGLTSMSPAIRRRKEKRKENLEGRGLIGERE